ncbi:hypothetical protein CUMW_187320 [Citrus unshiu]|nr:hypothetical protein CUMW_187320 [Citrus unshiu]
MEEVLHQKGINTGSKERIWESDKEKYYEATVSLILDQSVGDVNLNQLKILTSKESKTEITQYWIQSWPHKKCRQITDFPHPYPLLATLQKELIKYQRKDGVQLTAKLYLPTGFDPSKDGPLPCLFWACPGEFRSKDAAGQVPGPSVPIIGEGDEEPNDRFVEQLVSITEAAVEELVRRGVVHPSKIAVGGLSYSGFTTANLLAHAPHLFCCGIARSGSYKMTLTPFGFQMSPFMSANKIEKPILLINGECDDKLGLFPLQTGRWLQKYCVLNT